MRKTKHMCMVVSVSGSMGFSIHTQDFGLTHRF
jgi:hypothetical protein